MDKKFFLAFLLSLLILILYPFYLKWIAPSKPAGPSQLEIEKTREPVVEPRVEEVTPQFTQAEQLHELENEFLRMTLSDRGASVVGLAARGLNGVGNAATLVAPSEIADQRGFFLKAFWKGTPVSWWDYRLGTQDTRSIEFVHEEPGEIRVVKRYSLLPDPYTYRLTVVLENLASEVQRLGHELVVPLFIGDASPKEKYSFKVKYYANGQKEERSPEKIQKYGFLHEGTIDWAALLRRYYVLAVHPEFTLEHVRTSVFQEEFVSYFKTPILELRPGESLKQEFLVYAGPQSHPLLKSFGYSLEKVLYTRVLGPLWVYLLLVLNLFYRVFGNYGWAVVALSALIKLLFSPLTHMSYESMRKMQELQPKIRALQEQFRKDPQRLNQEVMQLYKRNKVNPFGGCLPLLIQMPVFIALYQTLSQAVELRGAPFIGWIKDLSEPDQLFLLPFGLPFLGNQVNILPILMIGTMVWQQKVTPQTVATQEQKMLFVMMPILMGFIFYGLPSGLVLYWTVSNVLTIFHQIFLRKRGFLAFGKA